MPYCLLVAGSGPFTKDTPDMTSKAAKSAKPAKAKKIKVDMKNVERVSSFYFRFCVVRLEKSIVIAPTVLDHDGDSALITGGITIPHALMTLIYPADGWQNPRRIYDFLSQIGRYDAPVIQFKDTAPESFKKAYLDLCAKAAEIRAHLKCDNYSYDALLKEAVFGKTTAALVPGGCKVI